MSIYRLYYFNARGRAEISRLIFAAAGQKFEDIRYEFNEWPAHKSETPLGQLPLLEVDGVKLVQSSAIARFLARKFHLAGRDTLEQAKVEAVTDTINDVIPEIMSIRREQNESKKQQLLQKFSDNLPKYLQNLEILAGLYSNGGCFFVGNHLTWADLFFYDLGETILQCDRNSLNTYPWLKQNRSEVAKQPRIAEYLKNGPKTPF
ncbi:unnamed protein product [Adineta steineri]|uniref:glutathione transferase n=1 Tax=Adineta steineri TaxID=433720 RepID=A0A815PMQ1_9BILA|nr:unnamed protein product [Adineta steineri]CAF4039854.1 unnamed protein product [Adineta steineri]